MYLPYHSQYLSGNSSYCLLYNSYDVTLENFVLHQLIILLKFFFIFITCLLKICLIL